MAILSLRAYARHRGCALSAVQKAIATHRIFRQPDGHIDSERADREWSENTAPHAPYMRVANSNGDGAGLDVQQYTRVRALRELYQARLAKLEYDVRTGRLVSRDEIQTAAFNEYRRYRDRILNIPDRVAGILAAETDPAKCHQIISAEICNALT